MFLATGRQYGNAIGVPLLITHPSSLAHDTGAHPERADRLRAIEAELEARALVGYERREAPPAEPDWIAAVHRPAHLERVRRVCERGAAFDLDTPASPGSWEAALHAAGGAVEMVRALMEGEAPTGFVALRPPGHHAEPDRAMGFCLFNNVAIAARRGLDALGAERVFVLDWDVHHGNGTNTIFHRSPKVLYASVHQWPFYPGTGALGDVGAGEGEGFSINLPVPAGSGEETWLSLVEHVVVPAARQFRPDLVIVSAGFDAHRADPIGGCVLETGSYRQLAGHVRLLSEAIGAPAGAVLEGGYDLKALGQSVAATMEGLAGGEAPRSVPPDRLTEAAAQRIRRYWRLD